MSSRLRRYGILLGVVIALAGWGGYRVNRYYHALTDGFSVAGISAPMTFNAAWETAPLSAEAQEQVVELMHQPFTYLAKGTQSFVFVSADDRFVLKFFKQMHLRLPWYRELVSYIPGLGQVVEKKVQRRCSKQEKIFSGCKLGYEDMQRDTGVFYLHLNPTTDLPNELTLVDKQGLVHVVNPNEFSFYLQLKGTSLFTLFTDYRHNGDLAGAQKALDELLSYLVERSERGILDRDPAYAQNLGFIGGRPGNLDIGNLVKDPLIRNPVEYRRRIHDYLMDFRHWLTKNYPELVETYDARIASI